MNTNTRVSRPKDFKIALSHFIWKPEKMENR